jgi:glycosyltransferase involved in cell wall biosynthesis
LSKILHRFYDLHSGGSEVVVLNIVRALPEHQHVLVFNNYSPTWVAAALQHSPGVTLVRIDGRDFRRIFRHESPDVVLFHYYPPMGIEDLTELTAAMAARAAVYNHWGELVPYVPSIGRYCFPSPSSSKTSGFAVPRRYKTTILNPVADEFFVVDRRSDGTFRAGRHSRSSPRKFSPDFFQLFEQMDVPDLQVLTLGHTPEMAAWLAGHSFELKHNYWLLPGNSMRVAEFLSSLDVYVYKTDPDLRETCPLSILEALACGIPVVAEARGGIIDLLVPGQTGRLCSTLKDYKKAVEELHADSGLRRRYSVAAREWAREFASLGRFRIQIAGWLGLNKRRHSRRPRKPSSRVV